MVLYMCLCSFKKLQTKITSFTASESAARLTSELESVALDWDYDLQEITGTLCIK